MTDDRERCQYCMGWIPSIMISQHEEMCRQNPDNAELYSDDE